MYKFLLITGGVLLFLGTAFVVRGYIGIIISAPSLWEGLKKVWYIMCPFNVFNFIATMAAIAPGLILITIAKKYQKK